jgi:hypothetical protein
MPGTIHPAVAPVIEALTTLAGYQPTSTVDLADVLKSVHNATGPNLLAALADVLETLGTNSGSGTIARHLSDATAHLYSVGHDQIDYARQATGHWHGTDETDSYL